MGDQTPFFEIILVLINFEKCIKGMYGSLLLPCTSTKYILEAMF